MAQNTQARTVSNTARDTGLIDLSSLILLAILLAAGFILNLTVGSALATTGIRPQFVIAAYTLAILLTGARVSQAVLYGLITAALMQFTTSIPGLNLVTEPLSAVICALLARAIPRIGGRAVTPLVTAFVTTLFSGGLFAIAGNFLTGAAPALIIAKLPTVLGTAVFCAIVVQVLYPPLKSALGRARG